MDRIEQGMLDGENKRSAAKTKKFKAMGELLVSMNYRYKSRDWEAGETKQDGRTYKTMAGLTSEMEMAATSLGNLTHKLDDEEKDKLLKKGTATATALADAGKVREEKLQVEIDKITGTNVTGKEAEVRQLENADALLEMDKNQALLASDKTVEDADVDSEGKKASTRLEALRSELEKLETAIAKTAPLVNPIRDNLEKARKAKTDIDAKVTAYGDSSQLDKDKKKAYDADVKKQTDLTKDISTLESELKIAEGDENKEGDYAYNVAQAAAKQTAIDEIEEKLKEPKKQRRDKIDAAYAAIANDKIQDARDADLTAVDLTKEELTEKRKNILKETKLDSAKTFTSASVEEARTKLTTEQKKQKDILEGHDPENEPKRAQVAARKKAVEATEKEELQAALRSSPAFRLQHSANELAEAKAMSEKLESGLKESVLGIKAFKDLLSAEVSAKFGAEASNAFIENIKNKEISKVFKSGGELFKKAIEDATKKGAVRMEDLKFADAGHGHGGHGGVTGADAARLAQAETMLDYAKDSANIEKKRVTDQADSAYTKEHFGFETPPSAFNELIDKRMKAFSGVERERGVAMAIGSLTHLMAKTDRGEELSGDDEAQMMAIQKFLVSQSWEDDLIGKVGQNITRLNRGQLTKADDIKNAKALERVFVDMFHWGKKENGTFILENRSGHDRSNDIQLLSAYGGNAKTVLSERAVLRAKASGLSYEDAAGKIAAFNASVFENNGQASKAVEGLAKELKIAEKDVQNFAEEIGHFQSQFGSKGAASQADFLKEIDRRSDALEALTDFKKLALANLHAEDGGHAVVDIDSGRAHGQLADDARATVFSDIRKKTFNERSRAMTHSFGVMNEDFGNAHFSERDIGAMRDIYAGYNERYQLGNVNVRAKDHITGHASGEKREHGSEGRLLLAHAKSKLIEEFQHSYTDKTEAKKKAEARLAMDFATSLAANPLLFFTTMAEDSNLTWDQGASGQMKIQVGDTPINNVDDLMTWIKKSIQDNGEGDMKDFINNRFAPYEALARAEAKKDRSRNQKSGSGAIEGSGY